MASAGSTMSEGVSLRSFMDAPLISERDLIEAGPDYGAEGCLCGNFATPYKECPLHWALWLVERKQAEARAMPERELRLRLDRAELVADHWRKAALEQGEDRMTARTMAHPLCMVLAAINGEKRPEGLGVSPDSDEGRRLRELESRLT